MLPPSTAAEMATLGHEALSVAEAGLAGSDDDALYETAVEQECVIVTENFADFATITNDRLATGAPCVPVVFVQKRQHPAARRWAPSWHATCTSGPSPTRTPTPASTGPEPTATPSARHASIPSCDRDRSPATFRYWSSLGKDARRALAVVPMGRPATVSHVCV